MPNQRIDPYPASRAMRVLTGPVILIVRLEEEEEMQRRSICVTNLLVLAAVLAAVYIGSAFHQINMNRKYRAMVSANVINTNALSTLEQYIEQNGIADGQQNLAKHPDIDVPRWMNTSIRSTVRLVSVVVVAGIIINLFLMIRSKERRKRLRAEPKN